MDRPGVGRTLRRLALGAVGVLLAIQLVPYGWRHPNPPVTEDAPWPDAETAAIARESCYACHSNETDWPAYSYVAPFSWLVRDDVESGRDELNFSAWDRDAGEADDAIETIVDGTMPLDRYTLIHRGARLTDAEAQRLVDALAALDRQGDGGDDDSGGDDSGPGGGDGGG
jgi:Haem-binding domain